MRRGAHFRMIDPGNTGRGIREERMGAISERELARQDQLQSRYGDRYPPFLLPGTLGPWFRENVGSAGAATYGMRLMTLDTTTSLAASGTGIEMKQKSPGKVWGGLIHSSAIVTAGTATLALVVDSTTTYTLGDIALDAVDYTRSCVYRLGWERGIPFAEGQTIEPVIITDASFAPTTADLVAYLFIAFEEPG